MRECEHECRRVRARMCERVCVKAGECTVCTFVRVCMYVCTCVCVCVCEGVVAGPTLHIPPSTPSAVQRPPQRPLCGPAVADPGPALCPMPRAF